MLTHKQRIALIIIVAGSFIAILNQTLVTPALPAIMEELHVDTNTGQWLSTGFTLFNAIMIPITAYLQDRFSTKRLFVFSMIVFAVGSLLCATAFDFSEILVGRLIQACAAGILMPLSMTFMLVVYPPEKRGQAMGIFGMVIAFAPSIGPTISGIVVDTLDWHILFYGTAALSFLFGIVGVIAMEKGSPEGKGDSSFDVPSVILSTLGFGMLLFGFSAIGTFGFSLVTIATILVGCAGVVGFFLRETHMERPMLRVQVLENRQFLMATIIGMLAQASLLAAAILMPIYVQNLLGMPATVSGLILMPGAILMGIMNPVAGRLFDKHGPRALAIVGLAGLFISTLSFGFLDLQSSIVFITIMFSIRMVSIGLVNMPVTTWGMNALDVDLMNHGTSVNNTLRQVAGSLGTAVVISVSSVVEQVLTPQMGQVDASMAGINAAFLVSAAIVLVGLVLAIVFVRKQGPKSKTKPKPKQEKD